MREALLFCFNLKTSAAESHRMLVEAYGDNARKQEIGVAGFAGSMTTILTWVTRSVKIGPGRLRTINCRLFWTRINTQSQKMVAEQLGVSQAAISMRLRATGKVQKIGKWVPHELNDRQMEWRQNTCQILLARQKRKTFLYRIVIGDERWIYFQNPKCKKSWVDPAQPSTSSRLNRFGRKTMLCVWWDQEGVIYYELLKSDKIVNAHCYHQQLIKLHHALRKKRPHYQKRYDNWFSLTTSHTSTMVQNYLNTLNWEVLPHPAYSPDLAFCLSSVFVGHAFAERHFDSYEDVRKWLDEWFASKVEELFWRGIHKLPERWEKCIVSEGKYFE